IAVPVHPDDVFPTIALQYLSPFAALVFVIGLVSALFPSADGALTALTSSFCIDILGLQHRSDLSEEKKTRQRWMVHFAITLLFLVVIVCFKSLNNGSVITAVLKIAGYTYGPLLGLFVFGLYTGRKINDKLAPFVCVVSPVISFLFDKYSTQLFWGYQMGFEVLLLNGLITFIGLYAISKRQD
ncbi:MAG TPA: hypothetical protein VG603_14850, partial [Chitinophagales bacterium]|nr:hypothetical protein [Chitinophagales bacterium]